MHIPDNFLSTPVWAGLDAIAIPAVAVVSRQAQKTTESNRLPLLGVMGAFVFAAQMINFPVGVGTSGHLVGGTLLACLLGPWAAALVVTAILIVQALVFQDGGVLALGANVVNMALLGVLAGYLPARWLSNTRWKTYGVFMGGTCSVLVSGALALTELLISGIRIPNAVIGVSLGLFAVNALIEGGITVSVLRALERVTPGIAVLGTEHSLSPKSRQPRLILTVAVVSVILAAVGALLASSLPDGLEQLARKLEIPYGLHRLFRAPLTDYRIRELGATWLSRATAGIAGLLLIYVACAVGGHLLVRRRRSCS